MAKDDAVPAPSVAYEEWSPEQAEKMLGQNEVNRHIKETTLDKYIRDMRAGHWRMDNGETIKISATGKLLDGQHRLTAQVKADTNITWLVVRGLPDEAQKTMDIGSTRTLSDVLAFEGIRYGSILSVVLRLVSGVKSGRIGIGRYAATLEECLETLREHPELTECTAYAAQYRGSNTMTPLAPSVLATAHWLIAAKNDWDEADAFITRICTLSMERPGSPVLALAKRINEAKRQGISVKPHVWLSLVIKAWNYDAEGKSVNKLALYQKGDGSFKMPEVKKRTVAYVISDPMDDDTEDEVTSDVES